MLCVYLHISRQFGFIYEGLPNNSEEFYFKNRTSDQHQILSEFFNGDYLCENLSHYTHI